MLAVGTLTAVRVPAPELVDRAAGRWCALLTWVPGLVVGLGVGLIAWLAGLTALPGPAVGLACVAWILLVTRAFHADGLADLVDGLTSGYDRERSLQIMKTGDVGPAGAASLVVVLGLDAVCLGALADRGEIARCILAVVLSRVAIAVACHRAVPAARPGGLGSVVAGTVATTDLLLLLALTAGVGFLLAGSTALAMLVAAVLAASAVVLRAGRRLGGITGDVLGAVVETALAAALLVAAAV